jgi:hypothetical protein
VNPTLVCPRGCNTGFESITNEFEPLQGRGNDGVAIMTVTGECLGCGLLCDNEIEGRLEELTIVTRNA